MIAVVAAALLDPSDKVLMHQRSLGRAHGGLWEFPGGKIESGETAAMALARELEEELGITIAVADAVPLAAAEDGADAMRIELWVVRSWSGEPRCIEGLAIAWTPLADLLKLPMPPLDVPLAKALIAQITGLPSADDPHMSATPTRP